MKRFQFLIFIFFCIPVFVFAQNNKIDSLIEVLTRPITDSNRVDIYNQLSYLWRNSAIDSSKKYGEEGLKLAQTINYSKGMASSYEVLGLVNYRLGFYDRSIDYHLKAQRLNMELNNERGVAWSFNNLANCFIELKNFDMAIENLQKCLDIQLKIHDRAGIANSYKNFAYLYLSMNEFNKVISNAQKSISIADSIHELRVKYQAFIYIGNAYQNQEKYDSALYYYNIVLKLTDNENDKYSKVFTLNSIGTTYYKLKNYESALTYFNAAKEISTELNIPLELQNAYLGISNVNLALNDYKSAFTNYRQYAVTKDSLFSSKSFEKISILQSQYENEKRQNQINNLQNEKLLQDQMLKKQKLVIYFSIVFIIFFLILIFLQYKNIKNKKRSNQLLQIQSREIQLQKDQIEAAYDNVKMLSAIGNEITRSLNLETILATVYQHVSTLMDTTFFSIGIYHEHEQKIEYTLAFNKGIRSQPYSHTMLDKEHLPVWCIENKKEIFINQVESDLNDLRASLKETRLMLKVGASAEFPSSYICLPLLSKDRVLGIITVESLKTNAYTQNQLNILKNIAIYMAIALENAEIYKDLEMHKNEIEQQNEEIRSQTEELQAINDRLVELDQFKEGLTGMIVHDLKNPLNAVLNLAQEPEVKQAGKQMMNMVMNILDVYKYEETKMILDYHPLSARQLADNAISQVYFLANKKNIVIDNQLPVDLSISADREMIERVFVNILTNAIKFSPNNDRIEIISNYLNARHMLPVGVTQFLTGCPAFKVIGICDNGQGIPEDKYHFVFKKFGQVSAQKSGNASSTGLGLTFCKIAIEAHGGIIDVSSILNKGTTFWFTLPGSDAYVADQIVRNKQLQFQTTPLTLADKELLKPYCDRLKKHLVFEYTSITEILSEINYVDNNNINAWKEELLQAINVCNEEKYNECISI